MLTRLTIYDSAGRPKRDFHYTTNVHGHVISRIQKDYGYKSVDTVFFFKLYDRDKLVKDSSNEMPISFNYEYNKNGILEKTVIRSGFGKDTRRIILNTLDSNNRVVNYTETLYQNEQGPTESVLSNRDIFYDSKGKVVKEVEKVTGTYAWMANNGSISYVYDRHGNLTQLLRTKAASYFYTYNDKGLITTAKMKMKLERDAFTDKDSTIETTDKYSYTFRR